jgi:hypothetical protein
MIWILRYYLSIHSESFTGSFFTFPQYDICSQLTQPKFANKIVFSMTIEIFSGWIAKKISEL